MEPPIELIESEAGITPKARSTAVDAVIDFAGGTMGMYILFYTY